MSRLREALQAGAFAVTAEIDPPVGADPEALLQRASLLAPFVDAVNVTDGSGARVHMSGVAVSALLLAAGIEPVLQLGCRDRNRIALQADILGAAALGVENLLLITGDDVTAGDHPEARRVFDLDSLQALAAARQLRDAGRLMSGRPLTRAPRLFLGAVANPFAPPLEWRPERLAKKVEAGAQFVQTQFCFDLEVMQSYMDRLREAGLHRRVHVLAGVGPLRSATAAEWVQSRVPGVVIPDAVMQRLRGVAPARQAAEGVQICVEAIARLRQMIGVAGIHVMAHGHPESVEELLARSGLLPDGQPRRPAPQRVESDANSV